jgi:hypothetical protein
MSRPERHDVDYFPFLAKDGRTLFILESKYECKGTGFFTNVLRFLSLQPDHHFSIADPSDRMYFFSKLKCDESAAEDMLSLMAMTGKLDAGLFELGVVVCEDLLKTISDAYRKRSNNIITIDEIRSFYDTRTDMTYATWRPEYKEWALLPEERTRRASARQKLTMAVRSGDVIKMPCSVCGDDNSEAHHPDYDKPLEVVWVCRKHHEEIGPPKRSISTTKQHNTGRKTDNGGRKTDNDTGRTQSKVKESNKRNKQRKNPMKDAPKSFPVTDQMKAYANEIGFLTNLKKITTDFLIHHKSKGTQFADWYSGWQTWIRNDMKWHPDQHLTPNTNGSIASLSPAVEHLKILKTALNILETKGDKAFISHCRACNIAPDDMTLIRDRSSKDRHVGTTYGVSDDDPVV